MNTIYLILTLFTLSLLIFRLSQFSIRQIRIAKRQCECIVLKKIKRTDFFYLLAGLIFIGLGLYNLKKENHNQEYVLWFLAGLTSLVNFLTQKGRTIVVCKNGFRDFVWIKWKNIKRVQINPETPTSLIFLVNDSIYNQEFFSVERMEEFKLAAKKITPEHFELFRSIL